MSNEREDLGKMELGTSAENEVTKEVETDEPDGLPPKENKIPNSESNDETDPEAFDDEKLYQPAVTGKPMEYDEDEEKKERRNRLAIAALVLILLFALLLALGLAFSKDNEQLQGLISQTPAPTSQNTITTAPVSSEPTPFPTKSPVTTTKSPTTTGATPLPTPFPTPVPITPTFGGPRQVSELPCAEISVHPDVVDLNFGENNFQLYNLDNGSQVCGDTYAGFDPSHPNRNLWQATIGRRDCVKQNFQEGTETCEDISARRCTADELAQHVAQGSGCGADNDLLYTSTPCTVNSQQGYIKINIDLKGKQGAPFFECELNFNTVETITRCCGDIFDS